MRRSVPASTARDALTHMTGKNADASSATYGKRADAGVIHSGRSGLANSGSAYDESCMCVCMRARAGGAGVKKGKDGGHAAHCESCGPAVEPRGDLGVLVGADCPGRRTQVKIGKACD